MKKRLMFVLAVIVAFSMVLAACGGGGAATPPPDSETTTSGGDTTPSEPTTTPAAPDETYEFIVSVTLGEPVSPNWARLFKELQERSGGRLVTDNNIYWSGSLVPIPEIPKGFATGALAFGNLPSPNYPDVLPLSTRILNLPFLGLQDAIGSSEIWMQLYSEFPAIQAEFESFNIKVVGATTLGMYGLHFVDKKEVRKPSDLQGRKIVPYSTTFLPLLEANNAAGSYIPPGQIYESLEKGVVDGYVNNWAFQGWFGLSELMEQHVDLGPYGAFHEWNLLCMDKSFYDALPQDLQQLIDDVYWNEGGFKDLWQDTSDLVDNERKKATEADNLMTVLDGDELQVWKDALLPIHETELAEIASLCGDVAYDIYDRAVELIAEKWGN